MSLQGRLAHFGAPGARRGVRGARPARPPRLVSGTSTSMGGFPFRERGSGVSNRYNLDYWLFFVVRRFVVINSRQDSMATPGNFGGGSTGPDQIFLGITRAPPSAPGRGRAQSPVRRNPNPQTTEHEAATRAALAVKFPIPANIGGLCQFG